MYEYSGFVRENTSPESRLEIKHFIIKNSRYDVDTSCHMLKQALINETLQMSAQNPRLGNLRGRYCAVVFMNHLKNSICVTHDRSPPNKTLLESAALTCLHPIMQKECKKVNERVIAICDT